MAWRVHTAHLDLPHAPRVAFIIPKTRLDQLCDMRGPAWHGRLNVTTGSVTGVSSRVWRCERSRGVLLGSPCVAATC